MGRHLLRRKALIFLLFLLLAGMPALASAPVQALSDCRLLHTPVPGGPEAVPGPGLTLACAQGHRGPEVYSLDIPDTPQVRAWLKRYLRSGGAMRALQRALFYRRHISARLAEEGLPGELLFLPVLESDYRSQAVSVSGAAGLWQLMANTARPLGLRMDSYLDERRDFYKATDAALAKLRENYLYFSDWQLALAAYNCGLGGLARILKASGAPSFSALTERGLLPRETADYLPRFYALVRLGSYPGRNGLPLSWEEGMSWQTVTLHDSVSVLLLAEATGLNAELLRQANAELEYPITPSLPGGYHLKVPAGSADRVKAAIKDPSLKLLDFVPHRIVSGDTLYGISHHFGVSLDLLLRHNRHLNPRRLPLGAVVAVPVVDKSRIPRQPASTPPPDWEASGLYAVQPGDTLWALSRRYGISCEELAAANKLKLDDILKEGKMLTVPVVTQ